VVVVGRTVVEVEDVLVEVVEELEVVLELDVLVELLEVGP
jgi:hypothetical protein